MQERYLGDSHDFVKYALLRAVASEVRLPLGVNWYLTRPEEVDRPDSNDGEMRHHFGNPDWKKLDKELLELLTPFQDPKERKLNKLQRSGALHSETIYFGEQVPGQDGIRVQKTDRVQKRKEWHGRAFEALKNCDLIFLDPDNGFEVRSMRPKTEPKYTLRTEALQYLAAGKAVITIQFTGRCNPAIRGKQVMGLLKEAALSTGGEILPTVLGRVAPNILFITLAPKKLASPISAAIENFADRMPEKIKIIRV